MKDNVIYETKYWIVKLADNQYEIGRCVIDIKRDCGQLSHLTPKEWEDLHKNIIIKLEKALKKSFEAEMFNWSCLMNNAFKPKIKNPKPHVHFHFRPRYRKPVFYMGEKFIDEKFGYHYDRLKDKQVNDKVFQAIISKIKENL